MTDENINIQKMKIQLRPITDYYECDDETGDSRYVISL